MTRSLYSKFILGYLIFGLLGFITIATFSSRMTRDYLMRERSEALYDGANDICSLLQSDVRRKAAGSGCLFLQLKSLGAYLRAEIWVADNQGAIFMDSRDGNRTQTVIPDFDPTASGSRSYTIGNYYGLFNEDVLTVSAPVIGNYTTYGYVILHLPVSQIAHSRVKSWTFSTSPLRPFSDCPSLSFWSLPRPYIFPCEKSQ